VANNALALNNGGQLPALARDFLDANNELGGGISSGFAVFSFRGKVWRVKHKGEEHILERDIDGHRQPVPFVDLVIVKAPDHLSKVFYKSGYQEGSSAPPDCYSTNGTVPANDSPEKQHASCVACPWNKFGSRVSDNGSKGKRCADAKRLAVIPANDLDGEIWGGPMLLRVPAASLRALDMLNRMVKAAHVPYFAVVVRISFDVQKAHPEFVIQALRYLTDDEFAKVLKWRDDEATQRILDEVLTEEYGAGVTDPGNGLAGTPPAGATVGVTGGLTQQPVAPKPSLSQRAAASVQRPAPTTAAPKPATPKPDVKPAPSETQPADLAADDTTDAEYTEVSQNEAETEAVQATGVDAFDDTLDALLK
jgi:hypothetical protein